MDLMLRVNLQILVKTVHTKGDKFVTCVKIKSAGDSKLHDSPDVGQLIFKLKATTTEHVAGRLVILVKRNKKS